MISKFLPLENLSVEEVIERPAHVAPPVSRIAARVEAAKPKPHKKLKRRRLGKGLDLEHGINEVILSHLADGKPHRAREMQPILQSRGYSPNSVGSRLARLTEAGLVAQPEMGLWQLTRAPIQPQPLAESA